MWNPLDAPDVRFIPADAGNARATAGNTLAMTVHPRGRGERYGQSACSMLSNGSSPRTRGTLAAWAEHGLDVRFIPADAGNA